MLKIYNTMTRKKDPFMPIDEENIQMYVCGMTTYSDAHIGHARTYTAFDVIRRYLEYKGYCVNYVQNITDIDDKIIQASKKEGIDPLTYSANYSKRSKEDMDNLGLREADCYPKATSHVKNMIELIELLVKKKYAYVAEGTVYFSVEKFKEYGRLSGQDINQVKAGVRKDIEKNKKKPIDFALWKAAKSNEPFWVSPWGKGRPGWHIECSAMSEHILSIPFDIHGGGLDLVFPHHENEIAQAEAAFGRRFVNYWLHSGMLKVNGEKMSKSLGNIINIRKILEEWRPEVIRYFFISYHYRNPADFTVKSLESSQKALQRLLDLRQKLLDNSSMKSKTDKNEMANEDNEYNEEIENLRKNFILAMDDDFNTPKALEHLFDFVKATNSYIITSKKPNPSLCAKGMAHLEDILEVLTLKVDTKTLTIDLENDKLVKESIELIARNCDVECSSTIQDTIENLLLMRTEARKQKNFALADKIRDDLSKIGIVIEDDKSGSKWTIKKDKGGGKPPLKKPK